MALFIPFARACSRPRVTGSQIYHRRRGYVVVRWLLQRRRQWPRFVVPLFMASTRNLLWLEDLVGQGLNKHQTQLYIQLQETQLETQLYVQLTQLETQLTQLYSQLTHFEQLT